MNLMLDKRFSNTMRYIDDLLTLNNTSFHSAIDDIYPDELKLKKTSESSMALSYLDVKLMGNIPLQCMTNEIFISRLLIFHT